MSSIPGYELEDYVMWNHDLIVDGKDGANESLRIAEALGTSTRRIRITGAQFAPILALYEPYRGMVEHLLQEFDDENQSWRDYAGCAFDAIPDGISDAANELRKALTT